jgi:hypothetical protein
MKLVEFLHIALLTREKNRSEKGPDIKALLHLQIG